MGSIEKLDIGLMAAHFTGLNELGAKRLMKQVSKGNISKSTYSFYQNLAGKEMQDALAGKSKGFFRRTMSKKAARNKIFELMQKDVAKYATVRGAGRKTAEAMIAGRNTAAQVARKMGVNSTSKHARAVSEAAESMSAFGRGASKAGTALKGLTKAVNAYFAIEIGFMVGKMATNAAKNAYKERMRDKHGGQVIRNKRVYTMKQAAMQAMHGADIRSIGMAGEEARFMHS